jgi:hypothetical protein
MAVESILDHATLQILVTEANAIVASRTRGWDELSKGVLTSQLNFLNVPTVLVGQGARMLNGTPTTAPLQAPERQGT